MAETSHSSWRLICAVALAVMACGCARSNDFYVDSFRVEQAGWDTVRTEIHFFADPVFAPSGPAQPESTYAVLFTAGYDTLYAGPAGLIPFPDAWLGSEERVLVEACGVLKGRTACEQHSVESSPKRAVADVDIEYPVSQGDVERGRYDLDYTVERRAFDSDSWETLETGRRLDTWIEAYVEDRRTGSVRVPVDRRRSRFVLSRYPDFRDFRFDVNSAMLDADSASVVFDVFARLGDEPVQLASRTIVVRHKSKAERRDEVGLLTQLAAAQVLDDLKSFFGLRRAYVFINDWAYVALDRMYRVETELHWQDGFRGDWSTLTGELVIRSDGSVGTFRYLRGNESAERRWNSRMDSVVVRLDPVITDPAPPTEEEDVQGARTSRR